MSRKYEPGMEDAYVEVVATMHGAKLRICSRGDGKTLLSITLAPEASRSLAQQITLASMKAEEMRK